MYLSSALNNRRARVSFFFRAALSMSSRTDVGIAGSAGDGLTLIAMVKNEALSDRLFTMNAFGKNECIGCHQPKRKYLPTTI
mmetsp:Transcript_512/g.1040  ORF Transcript_512/g.1040 Transcript_512/m.1040 type:complete len:82 (+) Transcript_512:371-616(+)